MVLANATKAQVNPIVTSQVIGEYSQSNFGLTQQMAFDANDNLFINSQTNNSIYKITPSQNVSLFAGSGGPAGAVNGTGAAARFNNPAGICFLPSGDMLIADNNNSWMRFVTTASVVSAATAFSVNTNGALSSNGVFNPNDVKYSSTMNAYYVPSYSQNIVKYIAGGQIGVIPSLNNITNPTAVAIGTNNILYVAGSNGAIYKIAQPTPAGATYTLCAGSASSTGYVDAVNPLNSRFSFIAGLATRNDTLYIADGSNHAIRIMLPSGEIKTYIGGNGAGLVNGALSSAQLNNPTGIAFNSIGQMFISDRSNGRVRIVGTPPVAPTTTNQTLCNGATVAQLIATGTSTASTIKWYAAASGTTSALTNTTVLTSGTYYCSQVYGALESTNRTPNVVTIVTSPIITASNATICAGDSYTINPSGATSYTYSGGGSAVVSPTSNTTYVVTGSNGSCSSTKNVTVTVNPKPFVGFNVGASYADNLCPNEPLNIPLFGTNNAQNYSLNGNSIPVPTSGIVISPSITTVYTMVATNTVTGCAATFSIAGTVKIRTITITTTNTLLCAGQTATLLASASGAGGLYYVWTGGNSSFTGDNVVSPTTTTIYTVNAVDNNMGNTNNTNCSYPATFTQSVSTCTGIEEATNDNLVSIYPNPANHFITVGVADANEGTTIHIINALGEIVVTETVTSTSTTLNTENLTNGIYFVKVDSKNSSAIKKFIKQ